MTASFYSLRTSVFGLNRTPFLFLNDKLNTETARKNYDDIKKTYENCTLINLIDKKGTQKRMGEYF